MKNRFILLAMLLVLALTAFSGMALGEAPAADAAAPVESAAPQEEGVLEAAEEAVEEIDVESRGFLDKVADINSAVNNVVWGWPAMILILGVGLFLTLGSKGFQFRKFGTAMKETLGKVFHK